ncbi:lipopolysaccharide biosynthesis protein [Asticcacaulis excentricus]|uniref:Polysaccharide biosynthesis protein n=1 Tax=Asticcacaulis excentricus (strain ATCC 15261 / DSM 4724 / KCTC 12464 / NCIMB 9791 / VKM B-1370 / CB 48) TaxID=573065 RepID=E8RMB0_ASTEC|nr:oligosaccharide flippase family protein [Asticcacaulis excentricus]ADU13861.1 polysaccharide biosynthesis protein [Asticcacaulis excentricus CB 48]
MGRKQLFNTFITILTRFGSKGINFVVFALIARGLTPAEMSDYGFIFTTTLMIATVFDVGIRNSVAYYIGRDEKNSELYATATVNIFSVLSFICALSSIACVVAWENNKDLLLLAGVAVNAVSLLFIRMGQGVLIGKGQIAKFNQSELYPRVTLIFLTVLAYFLYNLNLEICVFILAFSNMTGAALLFKLGRFKLNFSIAGATEYYKILIGRGFLFMIGVVMMLLTKQASFFVIDYYDGGEVSGAFYASRRLTEVLTEVGLAVSVVLFSQNVRTSDVKASVASASYYTKFSFSLFMFLTALALPLAKFIVPIALGHQYASHVYLFQIILIGTLIGTLWTIVYPTVSAISSPITVCKIFLPNLVLSICISLVAHYFYGPNGVAWGFIVSNTVLSLSFLSYFKCQHGQTLRSFLIPSSSEVIAIFQNKKIRNKDE